MCLLFESIKIRDGLPYLLNLHERRLNKTRRAIFGTTEGLSLEEELIIPEKYREGLVKCRILYDKYLYKTEFVHYEKKIIKHLKIIHSDEIEYRYKLIDRSAFEKLKPKDTEHTEIIIVKKGFITDASYANLAFFNGKEWETPAQPLLKGIQREHLLKSGMIREKEIREKDLRDYKAVRLINAMLDFEECQLELDINIIENS